MAVQNDPVCGMEINDENAEESSRYLDNTFYFCSARCRNEFDRNPELYANRAGAKTGGPDVTP